MRPAVTVVVLPGDDPSTVASAPAGGPELERVELGGRSASELLALPAVADSAYLWFLTSDSRPDDHCLDELLDAVAATDSIAAAGPKLMHGDRLVSAGVTTTSAGVRVNPVGDDESDQGQHDSRIDTLALDLPGMLVLTSEVERIGLPARVLDPAHRGLEYSRRLRDLGRRVVLAPRARMTIGSDSAARFGTSAFPATSSAQIRAEQRYRLSLAVPAFLPLLLLLVLARFKGIALDLLANDPRNAGRHLGALLGLGTDARMTAGARKANARRASGRGRGADSHLVPLYADGAELAVQRRSMLPPDASGLAAGSWEHPDRAGAVDEGSAASERAGRGMIVGSGLHQFGDTEEELDSFSRLEIGGGGSLARNPFVLLVALAAVISGLFSFRLAGPGHLVGGAIGSTDVPIGTLVSRLLSPVLDVSTGAAVPADPYHLVLAVLCLPFLGNVDLMARTLILLAPIVSAICAWSCAGMIVRGRWVRAFAGLLWISAPVFTTALTAGRLGVILVWIFAPLFVIAARRGLRGSIAASATAGLLLFVITAGVPLLLVLGILLVAVLVVRGHGLRQLWLLVPTLVLAWPWLGALVREPDALLTMPGQTLSPAPASSALLAVGIPESVPMGWLSTLVSSLGGPTIPASTLSQWVPVLLVPMLILAFFTLVEARLTIGPLVWAVGLYLSGLVLAIAQVAVPAEVGPFTLIGSYPAAGMVLLSLGAVMILTLGAERTTADTHGAPRLPMRSIVALSTVAAILLLAVGFGAGRHSADAVATSEHGLVPALAADRAESAAGSRTLKLSSTDTGVLASLLSSADDTVIGTSTIRSAEVVGGLPWRRRPLPIGPDQVLVAQAAAALSADDAGDVGSLLAPLGVDFVLVDTADTALTASVSAAPGLLTVGPTEAGTLWRVDQAASGRYLVRSANGTLTPATMRGGAIDVPAGEDGRALVISSAAPAITAAIGSEELPHHRAGSGTELDWAQEFALPASGGTVVLRQGPWWYGQAIILGWAAGLVCLLVAIPFGRTRRASGGRS